MQGSAAQVIAEAIPSSVDATFIAGVTFVCLVIYGVSKRLTDNVDFWYCCT